MAAAGETQSSDTTPVIVKIKTPNPNAPRGGADVPINAVLNDATMTYTAYYSFDFGLVSIDVSCDGVLVGSAIIADSADGYTDMILSGAGSYVVTFTAEDGAVYESQFIL